MSILNLSDGSLYSGASGNEGKNYRPVFPISLPSRFHPFMTSASSLDDSCDIFLSHKHDSIVPPASSIDTTIIQPPNLTVDVHALTTDSPPSRYPDSPDSLLDIESLPSPASFLQKALPMPGVADLANKSVRKSHARKQPPGHIPRPRNAFIMFRCDFVEQKKVPEAVENDHRNISRIAGKLWREMSKEEKQPWIELAEKEKERHAAQYPNYRYSPAHNISIRQGITAKRRKTKGERDDDTTSQLASSRGRRNRDVLGAVTMEDSELDQSIQSPSALIPPRRSSSCPPPGSAPVPAKSELDAWTQMYTTQDDLARRPSRVVTYHSVTSRPIFVPPLVPNPQIFTVQPTGSPWYSAPEPYQWPQDLQMQEHRTFGGYHPPSEIPQYTAPFDPMDTIFPFHASGVTLDYTDHMANLKIEPTFTNPFSTGYDSCGDHSSGVLRPVFMPPEDISPLDCIATNNNTFPSAVGQSFQQHDINIANQPQGPTNTFFDVQGNLNGRNQQLPDNMCLYDFGLQSSHDAHDNPSFFAPGPGAHGDTTYSFQ